MNSKLKGALMIITIAAGMAAGFFGLIEGEYGTIQHENWMLGICITGFTVMAAGFVWLGISSGSK